MPTKKVPQRVFRIHQRPDGRYESRNETATDSPLGVDYTLAQAIGSATREAMLASREGCRVIIEVRQSDKKWKQVHAVDPPRR